MKKKRIAIGIVIISLSVTMILTLGIFGQLFANISYDFFVNSIGGKNKKPHEDVVLVLIDEGTLEEGDKLGLGTWPWPRAAYADILSVLFAAGNPKAVFFDIWFVSSSLDIENDNIFASGIIDTVSDDNERFIFHNIKLFNDPSIKSYKDLPPDIIKHFLLDIPENTKFWYPVETSHNTIRPTVPCLRTAIPECVNMKKLKNSGDQKAIKEFEDLLRISEPIAAGLVIPEVETDSDDYIRRIRPLPRFKDFYLPSMGLAAAMAFQKPSKRKITLHQNLNTIKVGDLSIPLDDRGHYLINYYKDGFPDDQVISMSAVLKTFYELQEGKEELFIDPEKLFKDKIIIVGVSAAAGFDLKATPIDGSLPGPYIQATLISNLLQENHISSESSIVSILITLLLIVICVLAILTSKSTFLHYAVPIISILIYLVIAIILFKSQNFQSNMVYHITSGLTATFVAFIYLSQTEGAEKKKFNKILSNMVDPGIVKEALEDLEALKAGGEKVITAFFSDVASFSTISEQLSSTDLAALLNEYLSAMTDLLKEYKGTLDKYIGDAMVGIFGAPIDRPDNALEACHSSILQIKKLGELRDYWQREDKFSKDAQNMRIRIGLNTGLAKVGFMGTDKLASYTMMGDTVNLAARLEAGAKDYGVDIMISEATNNLVKEEFFLRLLDNIVVKGKTKPVKVYELIATKGNEPPNLLEAGGIYEEGFQYYENHEFQLAIKKFEESVKARGSNCKAATMLIDRCEFYIKEPPADDWNGAFIRTHK